MGSWGWDWCQLRFSGKLADVQLLGWELLERGLTPQYIYFSRDDSAVLVILADETSFKRLRHYGYKHGLSIARIGQTNDSYTRPFSWESIR